MRPLGAEHARPLQQDLAVVRGAVGGPPARVGAGGGGGGLVAVPDVAVVAGQDHGPARLAGQLQQGAERADRLDRPGVADLLRPGQAVVHGVDHDRDEPVLRVQERLLDRPGRRPAAPLGELALVEQERREVPLAPGQERGYDREQPPLVVLLAPDQPSRPAGSCARTR